MIPPSLPPTTEAQMLCWLAFRDHMALNSDAPGIQILIHAWGIPTTTERTDAVIYPSLPPPKEAQMLCWLAFGDHMALKSDAPTIQILMPAQGIPTTTERTDAVITPSLPPPKEAQMLCCLAFRVHRICRSDAPTVKMFIPCLRKTHN